ncbi:MAG TPA: GTP pyrophosphokinase [Lachnospiraceae bacterium]|nr:GTP pyrophosphokinase [Lachnospiraceae bacterium]
MEKNNIYGKYRPTLEKIMQDLSDQITAYNNEEKKRMGVSVYEHLTARIKTESSMAEKCRRRNLPETPESALAVLYDAIGIRIVCNFIDDIYRNLHHIKKFENCSVVMEKDYIKQAKDNGYRSYHLILEVTAPYEDVLGNNPGKFFVEIQLRTIAMDSWASLEHQMKYKKTVRNQTLIVSELKRLADELASCDISMQTIRDLIERS